MKTPLAFGTKGRRRLYWTVAACAALLAFLAHEVVGENGYLARRDQHSRIQALSAEIENLKAENAQLTGRIQDLRSNPAAIEELAREQLHLARPGELIVAIPDSSDPGRKPAEPLTLFPNASPASQAGQPAADFRESFQE